MEPDQFENKHSFPFAICLSFLKIFQRNAPVHHGCPLLFIDIANVVDEDWFANLKQQRSLLAAYTELGGGRKRTDTSLMPEGLDYVLGRCGRLNKLGKTWRKFM